ncbi:MAG TPA: DUF4350 domain-containing protein [Vicinamibacterales bacterium]|nr:DUF4350 domain-containing protein [Vicinamibacterales bacterium]
MPASWRTADLGILVVAAVGTIVLTAAAFVVAPTDSLPRNDGSSFAAHPDGGRAAYLLLQELGYRVERSFEPLASVRYEPERTVLVIANPSMRPSDQDVRALRGFIERGGIVLVAGSDAPAFLPGTPNRPAGRIARQRKHSASLPSPLSDGVDQVEMPYAGTPVAGDSPYVPVYGTYAEAAVLTARFEKGRAIWWAGSAPLVNAGISKPGHLELFLNAVGPPAARTIVWDEFYHGHARTAWSYLAATPLPYALLQSAGLVALALMTFARRRRPIRAQVVEPRTSPLEFIDTMGGLYERAHARHAAIVTVRESAKRALVKVLSLPPDASDERVAAAAAERLPADLDAPALLERARRASIDPDLTDDTAVAIVAELQALAVRARDLQRYRQRSS